MKNITTQALGISVEDKLDGLLKKGLEFNLKEIRIMVTHGDYDNEKMMALIEAQSAIANLIKKL